MNLSQVAVVTGSLILAAVGVLGEAEAAANLGARVQCYLYTLNLRIMGQSQPTDQYRSPRQMRGDILGVAATDLVLLARYAEASQSLIIIRATNSASLRYHRKPGYRPKPMDVKLKTIAEGNKFAGLVVRPKSPSPSEQKNIQDLLAKNWTFAKTHPPLLIDPSGRKVYADYDIQGLYSKISSGEYIPHRSAGSTLPGLLNKILEREIVMHGAQDEYTTVRRARVEGPPLEYLVPGRVPAAGESYVVIQPSGRAQVLGSPESLRKFYNETGLAWLY